MIEAFIDRLGATGNLGSEASYFAHIKAAPFIDDAIENVTPRIIADWLQLELPRHRKTRAQYVAGKVVRTTLDETISYQVMLHVKGLLSRSFAHEYRQQPGKTNPVHGLKIPTSFKEPDDGWTYLTAEELAVVEAGEGIPEIACHTLVFAIYTGLRQGELCGLRRADCYVDVTQPFVRVRFSFDGPTKNGKERTVPLLATAAQALSQILELSPANDPGLVFVSPRTKKMYAHGHDFGWGDTKDNRARGGVRRGYKSKLGIERHVRFHDLRHTGASHLVMGTWGRRWSIEEISAFLGHADIKTTQRYAASCGHGAPPSSSRDTWCR